jgi:hypothetical protein
MTGAVSSATATNVLNFDFGGSVYGAGSMVISNNAGASGGINEFLVNQHTGAVSFTSLLIGTNGLMMIQNSGSVQVTGSSTISSLGQLVVGNGAWFEGASFAVSGGSVVLSNGGTATISGTMSLTSGGTILLNAASLTYSSGSDFIMNGGNLVSTNTGTMTMSGSAALDLASGNIIVNSGTMYVNTQNAYDYGGLTIANGAMLQINSNATFNLNRWGRNGGDAWLSGPPPTNSGVVYLNGGTFTFNDDSFGQNAGRKMINNGTIIGNGTLAASVGQNASGIVIASNGVLNILGAYTYGSSGSNNQAQIYDNGGAFGTYQAVSGGNLKVLNAPSEKSGASWVVNSGGTLEIASGVGLDLGNAFMPASQLNGSVQVDSGASLTLSGNTGASGQTWAQNGTFVFNPNSSAPAQILMPNTTGQQAFTNAGTFLLIGAGSGSATFESGFSGGNSYGLVNSGSIVLSSGGTLIINSADATTMGFSNTASGSIIITNGSLFRIDRTATGWTNAGSAQAVNMGTMILSNGTFQTALAGSLNQAELFQNSGTILVQGAANVTNLWQSTLLNAGTILITNNNDVLQIGTASTVGQFTNAATGYIFLGTNGASGSLVATNVGNMSNLGTIQGQGTITLGVNNATGGQNANLVNLGTIIATNYGASSQGTLFVSTGNANTTSGFLNAATGTIFVGTNMTLVLNRSGASGTGGWGISKLVTNAGTVFMQGGTFATAADGTTDLTAARTNVNTGTITGWGTYQWLVSNVNAQVVADARGIQNRNTGTLSVGLLSFTNGAGSTLGSIGTNTTLLLGINNSALLNFGIIQLSAGQIVLSNMLTGTTGGSITNFATIAGVGNVSSFPIVQAGANSSLIATTPTDGSNNLIATVGSINSAFLGAVSNASGIATLQLSLNGGATVLSNAGTISLQGGALTVNGTSGTITNTGLVYGFGSLSNNVANVAGGTVLASNSTFRLGAFNNANAGLLSNFNAASTLRLTNTILQNTGTIALNGGGLVMGGSTITNDGTILGPGNYSSGLYNNPDGTLIAQNGTLNIATNGATESVNNLGTFSIANASTLNVVPDWNNTNGLVSLAGGTLIGGTVTNKGAITGNGTIDSVLNNAAGGTLTASGGNLTVTNNPTQNGNVAVASGSTLTMAVSGGSFTNGGTININGGLMAFTNTVAGSSFGNSNLGSGTFINNGVIAGFGTNSLDSAFSTSGGGLNRNPDFINNGSIIASNGLLMINAADSFTQGGFSNAANGTIAVSNGATFAVNKTANYWTFGSALANQGTIVLNGGTVTLYDNGAETNGGLNTNIGIVNNGTILAQGTGTATNTWGSGLLNAGTIYVTNNNSVFNVLTMNALTNTATGQILLGANGAVGTLVATNVGQNGNSLANLGTVEGQGTITLGVNNDPRGSGASAHFLNTGTLIATNWGSGSGTLFISSGNAFSGGGFENLAGGTIQIATNMTMTINRTESAWANSGNAVTNLGVIALGGGTLNFAADGVQSNAAGFINNGTVTGSGFIIAGVTNAALGTIAPSGGTLSIDGSGGFGNSGTFVLNTGNTLVLTNLGAATGLTFSNAGTIQMSGGVLLAGIITNAGTLSGFGTIDGGGVINGGTVLALTNGANVGTLTVRMTSATNANGATVGVIGTNAVLNLLTPGGSSYVNNGTITISGGTILLNNSTGTITNFNTIAGVGNVASLSVVNAGGASFVAQNPISGLSNLIATLNGAIVTNSGLLGANSGATLQLTVDGGSTADLYNQGKIALNGGFITFNGGLGAVSNIAGGLIYGAAATESNLSIANIAGGTILASNGTLRVGLFGANGGLVSNFNTASTIVLTNTVLQNTGTIALNGGGLVMGGSTITNDGTIIGPGNYSSSLYNAADGSVIAQNGTLNIATNGAPESVNNLGTFQIANGSTLNVAVPIWNSSGLITNAGQLEWTGNSGILTNTGVLVNLGTVNLQVWNTGRVTNSSGTFVRSLTNSAGGVLISSGGTFSGSTFANLGGTVQATNAPVNITSAIGINTGTIIGGSSGGIFFVGLSNEMVNLGTILLQGSINDGTSSFEALRLNSLNGSGDFTNANGGVIQGAGFFRTGDFTPGGNNFTIWNQGSILATNGALIVQPADAFGNGGFVNLGGTVTVANAAEFGIQRSSNAWTSSGTVPINAGLIQMNGGSLTFFASGLVQISDRSLSNAAAGVISGNGSLNFNLVNLGTVNATNGTLFMAGTNQFTNGGTISIQNGATLTTLQTAGNFQNNGQMLLLGGTFVGTNYAGALGNTGTISGNGSLDTGRVSGNGGQNQNIVNAGGTILATNGTLFVNPGDSFAAGGFSNAANGAVIVANNATLTLNRTANAWNNIGNFGDTNPRNLGTISLLGGSFVLFSDGSADASRFVENVAGGVISGSGTFSGSISNFNGATIRANGGTLALQGTGKFLQAGTLEVDSGATMLISNVNGLASASNAGTVNMNGGTLLAGLLTNANWIFGNGSITGNVASGVINLSNSFLYASNGVLSASLASFTNGVGVTMGTLSTNATLDVQMPGGVSQPLINLGTLSFAGGTLLANGTSGGTITNAAGGVILGVGNVTQTMANNGTILAADPVSGLNIFSVGLSSVNSATIGASNGAILNVVLSGGAGSTFNNNGSISMIGGTLIISNGAPGVITNNFFVSGVGTITPNLVNNGTIQATVNGGVLDVSLLGSTNISSGYLGAGTGATLQFENTSLVNLGTIGPVGAAGGTIQMATASALITNLGTIQGINGLAFNSFVQNNNYLYATNGVVNFNAINGLGNAGTINIGNGGTLQSNSSNSWSNAGTINLLGGTLRTGGFTNAAGGAIFTNNSLIVGYGTIIGGGAYGQTGAGFDKSFANLGTILATNPISGTSQTLYISTGEAVTGNGIENLGTMIVSSNNTLALDRAGLPVLNTGTITINDGTLASTSTITNTLGGIIQGYGTLTASIVNQAGGTIRATNGLLAMTSTVFPINQGTLEIDNASTLTWDATNSWQNNGTISLLGGTLRTGGPTNVLAGGEPFTNLNYMVGFGTIIGGGAFNTNGPGFDKAILNLGTIVANGGTLVIDTGVSTLSNGIANFGTMIVSNATDTLVLRREAETGVVTNNNFILNTGTILINGGTLTANTAITNQFLSGSLPGLIQGFGTIALTNQLVNLGTIRSTNTTLSGNGVLQFVNPSGSALQINQSGTLAVEAGSQMIFGSDTNAPLLNSGTIVMSGGTLSSGMLTNSFAATFRGFGTITSSIINSGTGLATSLSAPLYLTGSTIYNQSTGVLGANNGRLVVNTVFTNAGTVSFVKGLGTFNNSVVNQGAWISDPSTNVFMGTYTVATNGYISMASGDVYMFQSNFVNVSSLSTQYNTLNGKFVMNGQGTQQFYVAGLNLGGWNSTAQPSNEIFFTTGAGTFSTNSFAFNRNDTIYGFSNNFAVGNLELSGLSTTVLMDAFGTVGSNDNNVAGLYLNTLTLDPGSLLIISNNVELYFQTTNGVTGIGYGTLGAGDNILLLDGSSFHQLTVVPEPSILMLFSVGAVAIVGYRRRKKARFSHKR